MPYIIAYTWQADTHSVEDTKAAYESGLLRVNDSHPNALGEGMLDEHELLYNLEDSQGNLIHPVFSTDEQPDYHVKNDRQALRLQTSQQVRDEWAAQVWLPPHSYIA